jgi:hypothetical protein
MAQAAAAMQAAGGMVKAGGDIYQGNAAGAAADYNAQMADQNAVLARQQAAEEARRASIVAAKHIGQISADAGASGVAHEGSVLDVLRESAANAELNRRTILSQGDYKAYGFESNARLDRFHGHVARVSGYLNAAGDLLGAGGKAYGMGGGGGAGAPSGGGGGYGGGDGG